jgi:GNAT superfamily N-acetyltransferase
MQVLHADNDPEIAACFPVMKVLRSHLEEATFVATVRRQVAQGYQLVFIRDGNSVVSVAGFRILEFLAWGKVLYVDDLITDPACRGRGYAGALLDWLIAQARSEKCAELHLDSGYLRHAAHRLYLNKGLELACHHFSLKLGA